MGYIIVLNVDTMTQHEKLNLAFSIFLIAKLSCPSLNTKNERHVSPQGIY